MPIPARTTLCRKGCCTVTWCPLEISWATTIHKFQGFEAGFDASDMFRHLIVDPGDLKWEQTCPGALYVALSRAKTMGTFRDDTSFPQDSAIYWYGSGISTTRILDGHLKNNAKKGGPKVKCLLIVKRDRWVAFLHQKKEHTRTKVFNAVEKRKLRTVKHTQGEVRERIAATITAPNKSWAERKKHKKYALSRSFFGQYAWLRLIIRYAFAWYSMTLDVQQRHSHFSFTNS